MHEHIVPFTILVDGVRHATLAHVFSLDDLATIAGHGFLDPFYDGRQSVVIQVRLRDKDQFVASQCTCPLPVDKAPGTGPGAASRWETGSRKDSPAGRHTGAGAGHVRSHSTIEVSGRQIPVVSAPHFRLPG